MTVCSGPWPCFEHHLRSVKLQDLWICPGSTYAKAFTYGLGLDFPLRIWFSSWECFITGCRRYIIFNKQTIILSVVVAWERAKLAKGPRPLHHDEIVFIILDNRAWGGNLLSIQEYHVMTGLVKQCSGPDISRVSQLFLLIAGGVKSRIYGRNTSYFLSVCTHPHRVVFPGSHALLLSEISFSSPVIAEYMQSYLLSSVTVPFCPRWLYARPFCLPGESFSTLIIVEFV